MKYRVSSTSALHPFLGIVAVVSGMDNQDVVPVRSGCPYPAPIAQSARARTARSRRRPCARSPRRKRWPHEEVGGQLPDILAIRMEVGRRVKMRADVERRGELLAAHLVECQSLDPLDLWAVVSGESRRMHPPVLREIQDLHRPDPHGLPFLLPGPPTVVVPGRAIHGGARQRWGRLSARTYSDDEGRVFPSLHAPAWRVCTWPREGGPRPSTWCNSTASS